MMLLLINISRFTPLSNDFLSDVFNAGSQNLFEFLLGLHLFRVERSDGKIASLLQVYHLLQLADDLLETLNLGVVVVLSCVGSACSNLIDARYRLHRGHMRPLREPMNINLSISNKRSVLIASQRLFRVISL